MQLILEHKLTYTFDTSPDFLGLALKLFPSATFSQNIEQWDVTINDQPVTDPTRISYGNRESTWLARKTDPVIEVLAKGQIGTTDNAGVLKNFKDYTPAGVFLRRTPITKTTQIIKDFVQDIPSDGLLNQMHHLSQTLYKTLHPLKNEESKKIKDNQSEGEESETKDPSASDILEKGAARYEDFAHVFVACARAMNIPARYVNGYARSEENDTSDQHAWAEVFIPSIGWVGFDAYHKVCPTDHYVRLCCGLDAKDAECVRTNVTGASLKGIEQSVVIDIDASD